MATSLAFALLMVYCSVSRCVSALLVGQQLQQQQHHHYGHGDRGYRHPGLLCRDSRFGHHNHHRHHQPPLRKIIMPVISSAASSAISDPARILKMKELALQLKEENVMPSTNSNGDDDINQVLPYLDDMTRSQHTPQNHYDEDYRTPIESEFTGLISQFLTYTEQDIQSLTTTSNRYLYYYNVEKKPSRSPPPPPPPRRRSKEEGIRYRTIFSGVQAAALDREVLRAFTVLFEDYIPIRLAGRRIYRHLHNVMEEVRAEWRGEMQRARDLCPDWDCFVNGDDTIVEETHILEYGRGVWDTLMDEALLLDHSLESRVDDIEGTSLDGGVISFRQLLDLRIDHLLIQEGMVNSVAQLEIIVRNTTLREEMDITHHYRSDHSSKQFDGHEDGKNLVMTFPMFMNVLYQCTSLSPSSKQSQDGGHNILAVLQKIEQLVLDHRSTVSRVDDDHDVSSLLAAKAVHCGSSVLCAKREKYSNRFDEYVSTFQLWERKFLSGGDPAGDSESQQKEQQRFEILRGCFVGARNRRNVAALKIVYMDYAALRVAGDIIFQLMSKFTNKIM